MDSMHGNHPNNQQYSLVLLAGASKTKLLVFSFAYLIAMFGAYKVVEHIYHDDIMLRAPKAINVHAASLQSAYLQAPLTPILSDLKHQKSAVDCNAAISSLSDQLVPSAGKAYASLVAHRLISDLLASAKSGGAKAYYTAAGLNRKFEQPTYISAEVLMAHVFQVSQLDTVLWSFEDLRFLPQYRSQYRVGVVVRDLASLDPRKLELVMAMAKAKDISIYMLTADQSGDHRHFQSLSQIISSQAQATGGMALDINDLSKTCGQMI